MSEADLAEEKAVGEAYFANFTPEGLSAPWLSSRGVLSKGTKVYVSLDRYGQLVTTVEGPGRLVDKTTATLGVVPSGEFGRALFAATVALSGAAEALCDGIVTVTNVQAGAKASEKMVEEVMPGMMAAAAAEGKKRAVARAEEAEKNRKKKNTKKTTTM